MRVPTKKTAIKSAASAKAPAAKPAKAIGKSSAKAAPKAAAKATAPEPEVEIQMPAPPRTASKRSRGAKKTTRPKNILLDEADHLDTNVHRFFGLPMPGCNPTELHGALIVVEGADGSGRSTQIMLLKEWLESNGFAVMTVGLRRSNLVARNIDDILARNSVTRHTLALMYAADFFDQVENIILPALRAGLIVLADRYIFSLIARAAVRGLSNDYLYGIYQLALRPDLTFWLNVSPQMAFDREFRKAQTISYWESGRDMYLSPDLHESFILYQSRIKDEFQKMSRQHGFVECNGEESIADINLKLRKRIAHYLRIKTVKYKPSSALAPLLTH